MIYLNEVESNQRYEGQDGWTLQREGAYLCNTPKVSGAWVLRQWGKYLDHDQYRYILRNRWNLSLTGIRE